MTSALRNLHFRSQLAQRSERRPQLGGEEPGLLYGHLEH
jgi:hypothetical protein